MYPKAFNLFIEIEGEESGSSKLRGFAVLSPSAHGEEKTHSFFKTLISFPVSYWLMPCAGSRAVEHSDSNFIKLVSNMQAVRQTGFCRLFCISVLISSLEVVVTFDYPNPVATLCL